MTFVVTALRGLLAVQAGMTLEQLRWLLQHQGHALVLTADGPWLGLQDWLHWDMVMQMAAFQAGLLLQSSSPQAQSNPASMR